jgi:[NiFe] hydrogenase large subunit
MSRIIIDPITRIEGHLKIEVEVSGGAVTSAWSSGTLYRGIETILRGRDAEDAWLFAQRVCGVCTYVHGSASVKCVENAFNVTIPQNAHLIRNLLMGSQYIHDHIMQFYHLHGLDWIDVKSALDADVAKATEAATAVSPTNTAQMDFADTKTKLTALLGSGLLASGYWGHSAYILKPEENLLLAAHYLYALRIQLKAAKMMAIFGAKNPHVQTLRVGGVTCKNEITADAIALFSGLLGEMQEFINKIYVPDVTYLAKKYKAWNIYGGFTNYLAYGDFASDATSSATKLFPGGFILAKDLTSVKDVDLAKITEHVARSWYDGSALQPSDPLNTTTPKYTSYDTASRYSWLKAPRYDDKPMEVGPLARVLIAYGKNAGTVKATVDALLTNIGYTAENLHSTLGRVAARALETKIIADSMTGWLNALVAGGETMATVAAAPETGTAPGVGLNEAPRGALGHWITVNYEKTPRPSGKWKGDIFPDPNYIKGDTRGLIGNYQMVVPSTWNLGPRDANGVAGPVEQALIGTPVADPTKPVEILRTIHSYDPCLACAVHVIDRKRDKRHVVRVV